jgi:hypothetical protein
VGRSFAVVSNFLLFELVIDNLEVQKVHKVGCTESQRDFGKSFANTNARSSSKWNKGQVVAFLSVWAFEVL